MISQMRIVLSALLLTASFSSSAQEKNVRTFLPRGHVFRQLYLDPTECQTSGGFYAAMESGSSKYRLMPQFAIGFQKGIFHWKKAGGEEWDIGLELASFTQFEWKENPDKAITGNSYQRNFINVDYRIGMPIGFRKNNYSLRIRMFHTSSHLGDDYIIRNKILGYTPNANNYEQLDVINSFQAGSVRYYAGAGLVVRPETIRKRASLQAGIMWERALKASEIVRWVGGADIKSLEQNRFRPSANIAAGMEIGKKEEYNFKILLLYYNGHLPYSQYESTKLQWAGIGLYFNPS